jgi:iron complex outermembrane receptor protein
MTKKTRFKTLAGRATAGLCAMALCASVHAQTQNFDIAGGEMKAALDAYARQSGTQLIYKTEDVKGLSSKGLKRSLPADEALGLLLEGTALKMRRDSSGAVVIFVDVPPPRPEKRAEDDTNTLGTVVVSATRRREPVREVPMQVSTLSLEQLDRAGAKSLQDYMGNEAGVDFKSIGGGPGLGSLSIRGATTGTQTISTVGIYIDDVAFGSSTAVASGAQMALDMGLLDLNHIELLRGPQGTLYGASSMGGLLKYVTNEPDTYEFSGKVVLSGSITRGGDPSHTVSAVMNAPLKEDVAGLRVSAFKDHGGGYVDAVGPVPGQNVNNGNTVGARASVLLVPTNRAKVRLTGTTQKIRRNGIDLVDYDTHGRAIEGEFARRRYVAEPYEIKIDLLSADVEYDFGWARLNSITTRQKLKSDVVADMTSGYAPLLANFGLNFKSTAALLGISLDKTTQEFRLTSKADKQLEWLVGFYANREKSNNRQFIDGVMVDGSPPPLLAVAELPAQYRETAAYGDLTWKFAGGLAVTGGLRVARNKQFYMQQTDGLLTGGAQNIDARSSDSSRTWLLTAGYKLSSTSSVYARAASGYRPGGPNAVLRNATTGEPLAPTSFGPDALTSYELGYKADLLDKRLSVETAVFKLDWQDLQQFLPVNGVSVVVNAGAARVYGAELNVAYRPDKQWTLSGNAAYLDARLSEDAPGLGAKAGARMPTSARFSASLNASYAFSLMGHPSYAGVSYRFVGQRNDGYENSPTTPLFRMPAYSMTDLQAGIDFKRFSVALFARNVFDKYALLGSQSVVQPLGGPFWGSPAQPRTLGATVTVPF